MKKRPNALFHMFGYGFVYGWLLAILYLWLYIIVLGEGDTITFVEMIESIVPSIGIGALFGGLPGGVMGIIGGFLLWAFTRGISLPITREMIGFRRNFSIVIIGLLTMFGMWVVMSPFVSLLMYELSTVVAYAATIIPSLIAGGAAAYAVNRYMLKLLAWGGSIEKSKNKAKHEMKNNLAYEESLSENTLKVSDSEHQVQMKQD